MPKIAYIKKRFGADRLALVVKANEIIEEYQQQGFELTLRQLYYQFVARGLIENNMRSYKNLGDVINDARMAGLVDWLAIVDRTRNLRGLTHWASPSSIVKACAEQFRIEKWARQKNRVEVWIEKDALVGVIEPVCNELDVSYFSCRGYTSQSEMWVAAQRLLGYVRRGQVPHILHFGDHDPSGKDMSRDILDRLNQFIGTEVDLRRMALNMDQVRQYNPPPNPAKITDSRAKAYIEEFGEESWELDALEPRVIADLIRNAVVDLRNSLQWDEDLVIERTQRGQLQDVSDKWETIVESL